MGVAQTVIMVRVRPGCRLKEDGCTYVEGQTFWTTEERLGDLIGLVDKVSGVPTRTGMMAEPEPQMVPKFPMPEPEIRLVTPREPPVKSKAKPPAKPAKDTKSKKK